ncbi:hypothetical protein GQ53DRAFT_642223 [Thozetella sp. PMI_491]|nr:hypothetical protein GQ53DRAFT_642223 [Thozetella sp. PMI_491]
MEAATSLPHDIWWLVAKELANRRDFQGLFVLSRVNKAISVLAMPQLYSIHEHSPVCIGEETPDVLPQWACLWRSIVTSSLGQSFYPYCLWVKALRLGNLSQLLEDLGREASNPVNIPELRASFFSSPLDEFHVLSTTKITRSKASRAAAMDIDAIVAKVADTVTEFVKASADSQDMTVALSNLEGRHLPTARLTTWISRLSNLTSLAVHDGSVLDASVGQALRESCPLFKELRCFLCKAAAELDQGLAGFFLALRPNTIEDFAVLSMNDIGAQSLAALNTHAKSLKRLHIYFELTAMQSFDALSDCKNLEGLTIHSSYEVRRSNWESEYPGVFEQVVDWLKQCTSLTGIIMEDLPSAMSLLTKVLKEPTIRLRTLATKVPQIDEEFYIALGTQNELRELSVRTDEDLGELDGTRHRSFMNAVCNCPELLELVVESEMMALDDIVRITQSATRLETFRFTGDFVGDDYLTALAQMHQLKNLSILAPSEFTQAEEDLLSDEIKNRLGGRIDIGYLADPEDLHESDFSD